MAHVFGLIEGSPQDNGMNESVLMPDGEGETPAAVYEGSGVGSLEDLFWEGDDTGVNFDTVPLHSAAQTENSDVHKVTLKPCKGKEGDDPGWESRPVLEIDSRDNPSVVLGRGNSCALSDQFLPQRAATVRVTKEGRVMLQREDTGSPSASVCVDSTIVNRGKDFLLWNGCVVSLSAGKGRVTYHYKVSISDSASTDLSDSETCSETENQGNQEKRIDDEVRKVHSQNHSLMVGEVTCSVCMDIMVRATALNPCGHTFCYSCVHRHRVTGLKLAARKGAAPITSCPNCRQPTTGACKMTMLDNIILCMLKRGDFPVDDAREFLKRANILLTEQELRSVLRGGLPPEESDTPSGKKRVIFPGKGDSFQNAAKKLRMTNPSHQAQALVPNNTYPAQVIDLSWRQNSSMQRGGSSREDPICLE